MPLYQRRYSWEHDKDKDPLGQLWNDPLQLVGDGGAGTHFLGSIVLAPSPTNTAGGITRWIVVDGQQRLTTLSWRHPVISEPEDGFLARGATISNMDLPACPQLHLRQQALLVGPGEQALSRVDRQPHLGAQ